MSRSTKIENYSNFLPSLVDIYQLIPYNKNMENFDLSLLKEEDAEQIEKICKALASPLRLKFLRQLHENPMTITEIAKTNGITNSTAIFHLNLMMDAKILKCKYIPSKKGIALVYSLNVINFIKFERRFGLDYSDVKTYVQNMKVGMYVDCSQSTWLGIATKQNFVTEMGGFFYEGREDAIIIWTQGGKVSYAFNSYAFNNADVQKIDFSLEICSETTCFRNDWKSDIFFSVNDVEVAHYLSPGDFGGTKGKYNPEWWPQNMTQFGNLISISITDKGTLVNNVPVSPITINDLSLSKSNVLTFSIYNKKDSDYYGGFNIFGKGAGNYDQDIIMTVHYK